MRGKCYCGKEKACVNDRGEVFQFPCVGDVNYEQFGS